MFSEQSNFLSQFATTLSQAITAWFIYISLWSASFMLVFWLFSLSELRLSQKDQPTHYYDRKSGKVKSK